MNSTYYVSKACSLPDSNFNYMASSWTSCRRFRVFSIFSAIWLFSLSICSLSCSKSLIFFAKVSEFLSSLCVRLAICLSFSRFSVVRRSIRELSSILWVSKCSTCFEKVEFLLVSHCYRRSLASLSWRSRFSQVCYFMFNSCSSWAWHDYWCCSKFESWSCKYSRAKSFSRQASKILASISSCIF